LNLIENPPSEIEIELEIENPPSEIEIEIENPKI